MVPIAEELDQRLKQLDSGTAQRLEQLVRDAMRLAEGAAVQPILSGWPEGYFERTQGALAGEEFERPDQGKLEQREDW